MTMAKSYALDEKQMQKIMDLLEQTARDTAKIEVESAMRRYRSSIMSKGRWCCHNMQEFAAAYFNINSPKPEFRAESDGNGFVTKLTFSKGGDIRFCPFCGVKL